MPSHCRNAFVAGVITTLFVLVAPAARANLSVTAMQATPIAKIESVSVVDPGRSDGVEAWVTRASNGEVAPATSSMLLYANDIVATGKNIKLVIRCLYLSRVFDSKATIYPNTQIKIIDNNSFKVVLGRVWFGVKGLFTVRTFYWVLGSRGTEFEVEAEKLDANLAVLDGVVEASETEVSKARAPRRRGPVRLEVKALEEVSLGGSLTSTKQTKPLTEERVRSMLRFADEAILAIEPAQPIRRNFPHFDSESERSKAFLAARFDAIWHRKPTAFDILGGVYSDWGEGAKALEAYNREVSLAPLRQESASLLTNIGESYRLIGDFDKAEQLLAGVIAKNQNWAPALNALGNVLLSRAEVARSNKDLEMAKKLAQNANAIYERSFAAVVRVGDSDLNQRTTLELAAFGAPHSSDLVTRDAADQWLRLATPGLIPAASQQDIDERKNQSRGVAQFNIGEAKTLLGDIAKEEKNPEKAAQLYAEAREAYLHARDYYPSYHYIRSGLNTVSEAMTSLTSLPSPPRARDPQPALGRTLDIPLDFVPASARSDTLATALSLAAVISYVGDSDVETCDVMGLMLGLSCCGARATSCSAYNFSGDSVGWNIIADRLKGRYDVAVSAGRLGSYEGFTPSIDRVNYETIMRSIDRGSPVILFASTSRAIVISGYDPGGRLVVLDPYVRGELTFSPSDWQVGLPVLFFGEPKPVPGKDLPFVKSANQIVELLLREQFYEAASKMRLRRETVEARWNSAVRLLERPIGHNRARVSQTSYGVVKVKVSVRCRFEKGTAEVLLAFDRYGKVTDFAVR